MKTLLTKLCLTATLFAAPLASAEADSFNVGKGRDGALQVSDARAINTYAQVIAPLRTGDISIQTDRLLGLRAGDLLMVLQSTSVTQAADSGRVEALELQRDAVGSFELARVQSASGGTVTLSAPLVNGYPAYATQVVRVPEYTTVEVAASGVLKAQPWDGRTGGVLAFLATQTVTNHGRIDASGAGFQGGEASKEGTQAIGCSDPNEVAPKGAQKGKGLLGSAFNSTGRGNAVNAGGGGVCLMAGGGGGGHGGAGGQGGDSDAELDGGRRVGGQGGVQVKYPTASRLVLGGGGGAGHVGMAPIPVCTEDHSNGLGHQQHGNGHGYGHCKNHSGGSSSECRDTAGTGGNAGRGGGILFVRAGQLLGKGIVTADGTNGGDGKVSGGSGGGAGGIIHARFTGSASCGAMSANGGAGGASISPSSTGPGGGGGGGVIFFRAADASCPLSATGGSAGTTLSAGKVSNHGADPAKDGVIDQGRDSGSTGPGPEPKILPDTQITRGPADKTFEPSATFEFKATKPEATFECSIDGAEYVPCTSPLSRGDLEPGSHTLSVQAIDKEGNVDPTPAEHKWTIDGDSLFEGGGRGCSATGGGTPMFSLLLLVMTLIGARKR